jgi:hypothetical protein
MCAVPAVTPRSLGNCANLARAFPITLAMIFALTSQSALGQDRLPTQVDLKAAYCARVVQGQLALTEKTLRDVRLHSHSPDTQTLDKLLNETRSGEKKRPRRLQLYLTARRPYLDAAHLPSATKSADDDWNRGLAYVESRWKKCSDDFSCSAKCVGSEYAETPRLRACVDTSFLPH